MYNTLKILFAKGADYIACVCLSNWKKNKMCRIYIQYTLSLKSRPSKLKIKEARVNYLLFTVGVRTWQRAPRQSVCRLGPVKPLIYTVIRRLFWKRIKTTLDWNNANSLHLNDISYALKECKVHKQRGKRCNEGRNIRLYNEKKMG